MSANPHYASGLTSKLFRRSAARLLASLALLASTAGAKGGAILPAGFKEGSIAANGQSIHYVIGGSGPAVVLIHGWPETWYEWRKVMPLLAEHFTVLAPDLRGFGDSSLAADGYDKRTLAADIYAAVSALGLRRPILVGHDWGGPVAYAYAAQNRDAVEKLVMIEGSPFGPWTQNVEVFWFFTLLRQRGYAERLITGREREFLDYFYRNDHFHVVPGSFTDESIDVYVNSYRRPGRMRATYGLYRTLEQDVADNAELSRVPLMIPVLAIGAEAGAGQFVIKSANRVAKNVTPLLMRKTGHFIPEERPEALARILSAFFANQTVAPEWNP